MVIAAACSARTGRGVASPAGFPNRRAIGARFLVAAATPSAGLPLIGYASCLPAPWWRDLARQRGPAPIPPPSLAPGPPGAADRVSEHGAWIGAAPVSEQAQGGRHAAGSAPGADIAHYWSELSGPVWFSAVDIYARQVDAAADGDTFVELGAWKGRSTVFMAVEIARSGKAIRFVTVDHWQGTEEPDQLADPDLREDQLYETFLGNIAPVRDYVEPMRALTTKAAKAFDDGTLAFVYVDAGHGYADVRADLRAWWPKIKPGGSMAGDDWCDTDEDYGVRRAVSEFFAKQGVAVSVEPGNPNREWLQWVVEKPVGAPAERRTWLSRVIRRLTDR